MENSESGTQDITKVKDLKPGQEHVNVVVRVLERRGIKSIRTRSGDRTIGLYTVGDDTGRVTLVAWGSKAASLEAGDVVEIDNAWVSTYRGEVQLNIGRSSVIERMPEDSVPEANEIPNESPEAPYTPTGFGSGSRRGGFYPRRSSPRRFGGRRGGRR